MRDRHHVLVLVLDHHPQVLEDHHLLRDRHHVVLVLDHHPPQVLDHHYHVPGPQVLQVADRHHLYNQVLIANELAPSRCKQT